MLPTALLRTPPAARYLAPQLNVVRAHSANGKVSPSEREAKITGDAAKVCLLRQCADYGDFTFEDGKLASFSINGTSADERVMVGDGEVIEPDDLVGFEVLSAAVSADDDQTLTVVMRFHTYDGELDSIMERTPSYWNPDGELTDEDGTSDVPSMFFSDSEVVVLLRFPHAEIGGEAILEFTLESGSDSSSTAHVPVTQG